MLDRTISRLGPNFELGKVTETAIRHDATIGMWFLESRMPQRYGKLRPQPVAPGTAAVAAVTDPLAEARRVEQLIEAAEKRIAEAEACLRDDPED